VSDEARLDSVDDVHNDIYVCVVVHQAGNAQFFCMVCFVLCVHSIESRMLLELF
jgi:hypothetical protein